MPLSLHCYCYFHWYVNSIFFSSLKFRKLCVQGNIRNFCLLCFALLFLSFPFFSFHIKPSTQFPPYFSNPDMHIFIFRRPFCGSLSSEKLCLILDISNILPANLLVMYMAYYLRIKSVTFILIWLLFHIRIYIFNLSTYACLLLRYSIIFFKVFYKFGIFGHNW